MCGLPANYTYSPLPVPGCLVVREPADASNSGGGSPQFFYLVRSRLRDVRVTYCAMRDLGVFSRVAQMRTALCSVLPFRAVVVATLGGAHYG